MYGKAVCICGAPIKWAHVYKGLWVHDQLLGKLKVSAEEAELIHDDRPQGGEPLHRDTYLHHAKPMEV